MATWLYDAGYRTALVGKYMNHPRSGFVPPGWDRWVAFDEENGRYFDYHLNIDGRIVHSGRRPRDYSTDVLANYAVKWLSSAPVNEPFFLFFTPFAPHGRAVPAPRDDGSRTHSAPRRWPPSFNERRIRDKPHYVRGNGFQNENGEAEQWVRMVESLGAVDDAVGRIVDTLAATNRLADTMIVFTSDNGLLFAEHRWTYKAVPYEESIRVPLVVRYPPLTVPHIHDRHLVANVDYAETFASVAGADHPITDGLDLTAILGRGSSSWRTSILLEHKWSRRRGKGSPPTFCGLRTRRFVFVRYTNGFEEFYDLKKDPYELRNRARTQRGRPTLRRLRTRTRESCSPRPPGMRPF